MDGKGGNINEGRKISVKTQKEGISAYFRKHSM
jgi:hypothetical protein